MKKKKIIKKVYALYHGDKFITIGTREELAAYLNVSNETIQFYHSPVHLKRTNYNSYIVIEC